MPSLAVDRARLHEPRRPPKSENKILFQTPREITLRKSITSISISLWLSSLVAQNLWLYIFLFGINNYVVISYFLAEQLQIQPSYIEEEVLISSRMLITAPDQSVCVQ